MDVYERGVVAEQHLDVGETDDELHLGAGTSGSAMRRLGLLRTEGRSKWHWRNWGEELGNYWDLGDNGERI